MSNKAGYLLFRSYQSDPLARELCDRLRWGSWRFAAAFGSGFLVLHIISFPLALIRYGTLNLEVEGGYRNLVAVPIASVMILAFVAGFYLYTSRKAGTLFQELYDRDVVGGDHNEVRATVIERAQVSHNNRAWRGVGVVFALLMGAFSVFAALSDFTPPYQSTVQLLVTPLVTVWWYMLVLIIVRALITIRYLSIFFRTAEINVHPLHPDGCGGLSPLRDYALALTYLVTALGGAFVLSAFVAIGQYSSSLTDILQIPSLWIGFVMYFVFGPIVFFGTLGTAHSPMQREKMINLQALSLRFNEEYVSVQEHGSSGTPELNQMLDRIQRLHAIHNLTAAFPVWPFDFRSIRQFGKVLSPLLLAVITAVIQAIIVVEFTT